MVETLPWEIKSGLSYVRSHCWCHPGGNFVCFPSVSRTYFPREGIVQNSVLITLGMCVCVRYFLVPYRGPQQLNQKTQSWPGLLRFRESRLVQTSGPRSLEKQRCSLLLLPSGPLPRVTNSAVFNQTIFSQSSRSLSA